MIDDSENKRLITILRKGVNSMIFPFGGFICCAGRDEVGTMPKV